MLENLDLSVIILCLDKSMKDLRMTVNFIGYHMRNRESLCVVSGDTSKQEIEEMKGICPTYKGKATITSLINVGLKKIKTDWGLIIYSGSKVKPSLEKKLEIMLASEKDIIYPIVEQKMDFVEGSSNGIVIHKSTFKSVGEFPETPMEKAGVNDFELAKLLWAIDAIKHGCQFKGVVGMGIA